MKVRNITQVWLTYTAMPDKGVPHALDQRMSGFNFRYEAALQHIKATRNRDNAEIFAVRYLWCRTVPASISHSQAGLAFGIQPLKRTADGADYCRHLFGDWRRKAVTDYNEVKLMKSDSNCRKYIARSVMIKQAGSQLKKQCEAIPSSLSRRSD